MSDISVGAFYNPHLGAELVRAEGIDHLAMADPPAAGDPWWPKIHERYTLLLHDYLGQLSEPLDERSIQRARALAKLYRSPWVAEHFQCLHTEDGRYTLNYVSPPLYTEEFLERFVRNANALKARLDQPLVMENIPRFFDVRASQMPEPVWLRRFFEVGVLYKRQQAVRQHAEEERRMVAVSTQSVSRPDPIVILISADLVHVTAILLGD